MPFLRSSWIRVCTVFRRVQLDRELDDELASHLEMHIADNLRAGMSPADARRDALIKLGGIEQTKEKYRTRRGVPLLETLLKDIRFGLRMLLKSPALTAILVITLALGIGANTAIFSIVNGFLLRPLPVTAPEQIVVLPIQQKDAPLGSAGFSYPGFLDYRQQADAFSEIFGVTLSSVQFTADGRSDQIYVNYVSGNFFSSLGVKPAWGRLLLPQESETLGQAPLVVLDYSYWQRRFNSDPGVVGRSIRVNSQSATIIGVGPPDFHGMFAIFETDVYLPMSAISLEEPADIFWRSRDRRGILAFGRLRSGVSLRQAQSSLDVVTARLASQYPATDRWFNVRVVPEKSARPIPYANRSFVAISALFLALASFVLLLACMNVQNILLARSVSRRREMGIRAALGANRMRLVCQMLAESILLALLGGAAGLMLGVCTNRLINSIHIQNIPLQLHSTLDWRVFAFTAATMLLTGIVVGLLPALRTSSADVKTVLRDGAQRKSYGINHPGFRNFLVVAQVAGSLVLLVAAGLFVRSLLKVRSFDLGFEPGHVLNVILDPHEIGYDQIRSAAFYRDLKSRVGALPGVQSASLASYLPMGGYPFSRQIWVEGRVIPAGQPAPSVLSNSIDPAYFQTMRINLLRGRNFTAADDETAPRVAIINETMASRFWPQQDPVGERFRMDDITGPVIEIVGVTANGKYKSIGEEAQPFLYIPLTQDFASKLALQIRSFGPPEALIVPVKEQVTRLAPDLTPLNMETMNQLLEGAFGFFAYRLAATLAAALGLIGLILAIVGVYGVVSFAASQRTNEFGIRMALGATSRDILNLIWLQGVRLVISGVAIGTAAAWAFGRAMTHVISGINASDPVAYIAVAIFLATVALVACWIPARRATRVDPMIALRYE